MEINRDKPLTAEIRLLGERIAIRTTDNDPEFAAEVIDLVSSLLENAEARMTNFKGRKSADKVTLLALLDLAEEYVRAKKRTADYKAEIERRSDELIQIIDKTRSSD